MRKVKNTPEIYYCTTATLQAKLNSVLLVRFMVQIVRNNQSHTFLLLIKISSISEKISYSINSHKLLFMPKNNQSLSQIIQHKK